LKDPETSLLFGLATLVDKHKTFDAMANSATIGGRNNPYGGSERARFRAENLSDRLAAYNMGINPSAFVITDTAWQYVSRIGAYLKDMSERHPNRAGYQHALDRLTGDATSVGHHLSRHIEIEYAGWLEGGASSSVAHITSAQPPPVTLPVMVVYPPPMPKSCENLVVRLPRHDRETFKTLVSLGEATELSEQLAFPYPPSHGIIHRDIASICSDGLVKLAAGADAKLNAPPIHGLADNATRIKPVKNPANTL
jgi:hypothetical protein